MDIKERIIGEAEYMLQTNGTVRSVAEYFGVSKSTVHSDLAKKLKGVDCELYKKVKRLLMINLSQRHIRGGLATREKVLKRQSH